MYYTAWSATPILVGKHGFNWTDKRTVGCVPVDPGLQPEVGVHPRDLMRGAENQLAHASCQRERIFIHPEDSARCDSADFGGAELAKGSFISFLFAVTGCPACSLMWKRRSFLDLRQMESNMRTSHGSGTVERCSGNSIPNAITFCTSHRKPWPLLGGSAVRAPSCN